MPLKFSLASLEGLDENIAKLYEKADDGKYYLQVEGAVAKSRLDEFRDKNIELSKQLETFKGVDVEEYKKLKTEVSELRAQLEKKGDRLTDEQIDAMLQERTKSMKTEFENQIKERDEQIGIMTRQLESLVIDNAVREAALANDVVKTALEDVVLRAKTVFRLQDGQAVPFDKKGQMIYGKDGASPMSPAEWIKGLRTEAPHLFSKPSGSGSSGGGVGSGNVLDRSAMTPLQKVAAGLASRNQK